MREGRRTGELGNKILIVEDSPQNMRLIEMTLRAGGYTLLKAADGLEALEIANREHPDLIVMDIQLPRMGGLEVTKQLRQMAEFKNVPIIAVTAYAMKGDMERFTEAGCDAYVSKPINTRALPGIIAEMLQKHRKGET
ncbi:response regulator [Chloroflexota bacterium]